MIYLKQPLKPLSVGFTLRLSLQINSYYPAQHIHSHISSWMVFVVGTQLTSRSYLLISFKAISLFFLFFFFSFCSEQQKLTQMLVSSYNSSRKSVLNISLNYVSGCRGVLQCKNPVGTSQIHHLISFLLCFVCCYFLVFGVVVY